MFNYSSFPLCMEAQEKAFMEIQAITCYCVVHVTHCNIEEKMRKVFWGAGAFCSSFCWEAALLYVPFEYSY
jgi:hypothetical protein